MISPYVTKSIIEAAVGLVLVKTPTTCNAMTVSFYSEVAHHPTALWVSIDKSSLTHSMLSEQPLFSLAVLTERQSDIALNCGTVSGRTHDKCSSLTLYPYTSDFLFLEGALSCTSCKTRETLDFGNHTLFIADIIEAQLESRASHLRQLLVSDLKN